MRFGVLFVGPLYLEIVAFLIVVGAFRANLVDGETQCRRAVETVAFVIAEGWLDAPRSSGVDVAQHLQVILVADSPIVTTVFKVEASVGRFAIGGHDESRFLAFGVGD